MRRFRDASILEEACLAESPNLALSAPPSV